jgi:hypothetical protein
MDKLDVLRNSYEILRDPDNWTTGYAFRNADGKGTDENVILQPDFGTPAQFCALGALRWVSTEQIYDTPEEQDEAGLALLDARRELCKVLWPAEDIDGFDANDLVDFAEAIADINDGDDGYEQIMSAFRQALANLTPAEPRKVETSKQEVLV